MALLALGINHQTAPVGLRERVAFGPALAQQAMSELGSEPGVHEAIILSTCNRTELYCSVADGAQSIPGAWLHRHHGIGSDRLAEFLYQYDDADAVRHLFRVATGLDSMVLASHKYLAR